jgi:hypothetical protein
VSVRLRLARALYPRAAIEAAALSLGARARALLETDGRFFVVTLEPARASDARAARGDFLNAALAHRCAALTRALWGELSEAARARLFAEGFAAVPPDPLEQLEPTVREQRRADRRALLDEAAKLRGR